MPPKAVPGGDDTPIGRIVFRLSENRVEHKRVRVELCLATTMG